MIIDTAFVKTDIASRIATITFYHPQGNSFPSTQLADLTQALNELSNRSDIAVIVLQSHGNSAFCGGASFDELLQVHDENTGKVFFSGFANVINAMRKCKHPIVGRAQGKAVGGGVGLLAACDYVFASERASIKLSELAIGIGPFVIEPAVSRKIGLNGFSAMTLQPNRWFDAPWALHAGLFQAIYADNNELDLAVQEFASSLSNYSPEALQDIKRVLWQNTEHWDTLLYERAAISGRLVLSEFTKKKLGELKA